MRALLFLAALIFLGLFAGIWTWAGIELLNFEPTDTVKTLEFDERIVAAAGVLASAVAAATAAVLGFEVKKAIDEGGGRLAITKRLNDAVWRSAFLMSGVVLYMGVGVFNLLVWLFFSEADVAPEMIGTFGIGVLGWLGGAFSVAYRP